jgi:iron complex transport system ATP-binding protein
MTTLQELSSPRTTSTTALQATGLHLRYPRPAGATTSPTVLNDVDLTIHHGETVALVGENGCGKSTLLGCLSGWLRPQSGQVLVGPDGVDVTRLASRQLARELAVMHQSLPPVPGLTVRRLVEQGRYAHRGAFGWLTRPDDHVVDEAIEAVDLTERADTELDLLSGGQRQRARLAVVLAQQAPILLLDEPTAHLDVRHQLLLLDLIEQQRTERDLTVVVVLHDLDHALRYADRVVAMQDGRIVADGPAETVVTPHLLHSVFGVEGRVLPAGPGARVCIDSAPTL